MTGPQDNHALDGYQSYQKYRIIIELFIIGRQMTFIEMAEFASITVEQAQYITSLLLKHKVVKFCRFSLVSKGNKRKVFKLL